MENLKGSLIRSLDKSHAGDHFVVRIDQKTKETLKHVFIKLMTQLTVAVQSEQTFCQEFFNIQMQTVPRMESSANSQTLQPHLNREISRSNSNASLRSGNSSNLKMSTIVENKNDL